jgi:hypothetical protein
MPRHFIKTKKCGCIVKTSSVGTTNTPDGKMFLLGGHDHLTICDICKKNEECGEDTLYNMFENDNITNNFEYAGWKIYEKKNCK